ncbi:MAG: hypothetical protein PVH29_12315 [Candidatus Zixiibacteriota bacterium]|jgi:hypothetical protein
MADDGNNGFKEFVREEIKNSKDAAARNYEEHQVLFHGIGEIRTKLEVLEERLKGNVEVRKAVITALAGVGVAAISTFTTVAVIIWDKLF